MISNPSYQNFATFDKSEYPHLWNGVVGAWCPSLGPTGTRLHDLSGKGNWGTLTNMDPPTDWVLDGGQYAVDFDGANDQIVSVGNVPAPQSRTIAMWVLARARSQWFCGTNFGTFNSGLFLGIESNVLTITQYGMAIRDTVTFPLNTWQHVVAAHNGNNYTLYRNGVLVKSGAMTTTPAEALWYLGSYGNGGYFNGRIDDATLWGRALSQNEVQQLYQLGRGGMYTPRRRRKVSVQVGNAIWLKTGGVWKETIPWIKVGGVWKQASPNIKISGTWK